MTQYIDKSAVVAEIMRIMAEEMSFFKDCCNDELENTSSPAVYTRMEMLLSFLDTIEVKEVDLEKELNDFIEEQKAWVKDDRVVEYYNGDSFNHIYDLEFVAKHFFELGLKCKDGYEQGKADTHPHWMPLPAPPMKGD